MKFLPSPNLVTNTKHTSILHLSFIKDDFESYLSTTNIWSDALSHIADNWKLWFNWYLQYKPIKRNARLKKKMKGSARKYHPVKLFSCNYRFKNGKKIVLKWRWRNLQDNSYRILFSYFFCFVQWNWSIFRISIYRCDRLDIFVIYVFLEFSCVS